MDQGWAVSHEGYPEVLWMQHVCFFFNGCVDEKASLLCEDSFSVFNGFKYLKVFQLVIYFFQMDELVTTSSILQKSSILNINNRSGCYTQTAFLPVIPSTRFQNDRWKSGILPIGSWTWSVAKWIMPQSRASNPQLWHRNGGMVWPTVGLFLLDTGCLEDVSLHQLLPLKKEGICLTNVVLLLFLVERKNAIVSRKQM